MKNTPLTSLIVAASLVFGAGSAIAQQIAFDGSWKEQRFSLFSKNDYGFNGSSLDVASDGSVSMAYVQLPESVWGASGAKWQWAVSQSTPATDLRQKGGDDRNLSLYAVYLPADQAQKLKGAKITKLLSEDSARVLVYVWGGAHNRGDFLDSPYLGARGKTIVLRGSGTGSHSEAVDLAGDYRKAFGGTPGALVGLAVTADSDDTDSQIAASISNLVLN
jgi:hypothetical protein